MNDLEKNYPERSLAIISPFRDTVKQLQKMFLTDTKISDLTVETIDRIQGITVDYAILYIPGRNPGFALDERRFNVATSRSRSTTFILSDLPLIDFHSLSPKVAKFLSGCRRMGNADLKARHSQDKPDAPTMYGKGESGFLKKDDAGALKFAGGSKPLRIDLAIFMIKDRELLEITSKQKTGILKQLSREIQRPNII